MKHDPRPAAFTSLNSGCSPESIRAAMGLLAVLLLRDGRIDWRELALLERTNVFQALGLERRAFLQELEAVGAQRRQARAPGAPVFEPELQLVRSRPLQLLICSLLVGLADADGEVAPEESALVRQAFLCWNVSPERLRREMRIPVHRSLAALGMLPEAA